MIKRIYAFFRYRLYRALRYKQADIKHKIWRKRIKQTDFTIISNNCWGGVLSSYLGIRYNSPTVGLIIFPNDYLKFCKNLKHYLELDVTFIQLKDSKEFKRFQGLNEDYDFPVGIIDDIEIYFMHYKSEEEAMTKWNRRKKRVNYNKILYKISERDGITPELLFAFTKIKGKKIIFTQKKYKGIQGSVYVPNLKKADRIGASEVGMTLKRINVVKVINSI